MRSFDELISLSDLAEEASRRGLFSKSFLYKVVAPGMARQQRHASFPTPISLAGRKFFVRAEIDAWVAAQLDARPAPTIQPAPATQARRGRPTKKEQAAAAARGITVAQLRQGGAA